MKILHLVRKAGDPFPFGIMENQSQESQVTCVLIQDACLITPPIKVPCYLLKEDAQARGVTTSLPLIDFKQLIDMIFDHDRLTCW
jgi:sulfur transfer complex TusBCD TusB component (DsrH family)